jgi:hypothetical protein
MWVWLLMKGRDPQSGLRFGNQVELAGQRPAIEKNVKGKRR